MLLKSLTDDKRSIARLDMVGGADANWWEVGVDGITQIFPYWELASIWFAVYQGTHLLCRVSLEAVESIYYLKEDE